MICVKGCFPEQLTGWHELLRFFVESSVPTRYFIPIGQPAIIFEALKPSRRTVERTDRADVKLAREEEA